MEDASSGPPNSTLVDMSTGTAPAASPAPAGRANDPDLLPKLGHIEGGARPGRSASRALQRFARIDDAGALDTLVCAKQKARHAKGQSPHRSCFPFLSPRP